MTTFRLVPGRDTTNKTNFRILHAIHDLGELKTPLLKRITWRPFLIREQEQIWWDILLTKETARFYLTVPAGEWADWVKSKIERMWEGVVISKAADEDFELLKVAQTAEVCRLSLKRHNIFSLAVDRREETHPIGDIMGVIDDLRPGEKVRMAMKMDPVERLRWQRAAEAAHKRFQDGQMPKRGGTKFRELLAEGLHIIMWLIGQLFEAFGGLLPGGSRIKSTIPLKRGDGARAEVLVDGRLSRATFEKANLPVFKCDIFVAAQGADQTRSETLITGIAGSLSSEMDENNEWIKIRYNRKNDREKLINGINIRRLGTPVLDKVALSTKELGKLEQLPTAGVQELYRNQVMASEKGAFEIPAAVTGDDVVPYGAAESRGKEIPVGYPLKNPNEAVKVCVIDGEPGSGKTTAVHNRALGYLAEGKSVFVYEFTKRMYLENLLNAVPADFPEDHIVCLDFGNREFPIAPHWTEISYGIAGGWEDVLVSEFWAFFARYADDGVARTRRWLKKAALACTEAGCLDPLNVALMLLAKPFRDKVIPKVRDQVVKAVFEQWDQLSDANQATMAEPIMSRLDYLLDNRALKNCLCQPVKLGRTGRPLIDFRKWADGDECGPYLVLIYAPKAVYSAAGLDALMAWLNAKEWLMTLTRDETLQECFIIKDEVHQIPSIAAKAEEQIVEGRKYRIGPVWTFHDLAQVEKISPSLVRILKAGNPNLHLLKTSPEAYRLFKHELAPFDVEKDLMTMENHWSVNRWRAGGKDHVFMCKLNPPPAFVKNRGHLWQMHSRIYGRAVQEVEQEIAAREMLLLQVAEGKKKRNNNLMLKNT